MLRVTVEVIPHGDEGKKFPIAQMHIVNDMTHNSVDMGNYDYLITGPDAPFEKRFINPLVLCGRVENHDRSKACWSLIKKALTRHSESDFTLL